MDKRLAVVFIMTTKENLGIEIVVRTRTIARIFPVKDDCPDVFSNFDTAEVLNVNVSKESASRLSNLNKS